MNLKLSPELKARIDHVEEVSREIDKYLPLEGHGRAQAARAVERMVDAWREIDANWTASDLGLTDTPEEELRWYERFALAGVAICQLGELLLESEI